MDLDPKREGEIAILVVEEMLTRDLRLSDIGTMGRSAGNMSKTTGVSEEELIEFGERRIKKVFDRQIAILRRSRS